MSFRFGYDFSKVRVHTDAKSAESAASAGALAYTVGHDIVFDTGRYGPQTETGRHLLAHELAHVVQQTGSGGISADAESKAKVSANRVSQGDSINVGALGGWPISVQKAGKDDEPSASGTPAKSAAATEPGAEEFEAEIDPNLLLTSGFTVDEFEFDKPPVGAHGEAFIPKQNLDRLKALRTTLIDAPNATVLLTGHTDTVGTEKYNHDLGLRRAAAVRDFLTESGSLQMRTVKASQIQIDSKGETEPAPGQPPPKLDPHPGVRNPKNRRVEIRVTGVPARKAKIKLPRTAPPAPAPSPAKPEKGGPEVKGAIEVGLGKIETTVEVTFDKPAGGKVVKEISFTLHVGPKGFEQLESDLAFLKEEIAKEALGGTLRDLTFFLRVNPQLNLDKDAANRMVSDFSVKLKASLEARLNIPKISKKIEIEFSPSVDIHGRPEFEFKLKFPIPSL